MSPPKDIWRMCGKSVTVPNDLDIKGRGCACNGNETFNATFMLAALARLSDAGNPASSPGVTHTDERQLP